MMTTTFYDTYEIKSVIGRGGMSTVYLAEHKRLHTRWAVKEVQKQQGVRFDFLAEANILKRLQHPMLPRIVDIFEDETRICIVEDFVEGISLEEVLNRQKRVEEETGLVWFRSLCGVLGYLHGQKPHPIIYRDLKPSNIMLQPDGTLKLIDFGIAREYKQESSADTTYIGTRGYAAPEQFGTAQTDARTDIYSLGVTMYHLLTGKSPYEPPYQFVPARQLCPQLSRGVEYILGKCVQPEPADRYQSVEELLFDLDHSYRFDKAWQKCQRAKRIRVAVLALMTAASLGLMAGGWMRMGQEKEAAYQSLLEQAEQLSGSNLEGAVSLLDEARELYPDRIEADRQQTYALYSSGQWQACVDYGAEVLQNYGADVQTRLLMAAAQFELRDYEAAAEGFAQGGELSADNLRDYAVCLGRLGQVDQAQQVLDQLTSQGVDSADTRYVQGEVSLARENYLEAEEAFQRALDQSESVALTRRCYVSLGDLYQICSGLDGIGLSPIADPASRAVEVLAAAVTQEGLQQDSVLWEMLAMAYFQAYQTDPEAFQDYLSRAADSFTRVLQLGVVKDYLYSNLFTIYFELGDYGRAEQALADYEERFPEDYTPHALRGMMLIGQEGQKPQEARDYTAALQEYEKAGQMIRSSDDTSYYQQLGTIIDALEQNGWL